MCLILWLQTNFKPGCNHLWCRTHELGRINPTPFVTFSTWRLLLEMASVGCSETFHSSEQGPGTPVTCYYTVLYTGNSSFAGKPSRRIPSCQSSIQMLLLFPAAVHPCAVGKASGTGNGQVSGTAVGARAVWEEKQLSKTGHGHHSGGVSRSAGVEVNLVCRRFYKVRK